MSYRLLLTSNGFTSAAIGGALVKLLGRDLSQSTAVFITTASNPFVGDKSWLIADLRNAKRQGFASLDVFDIAGLDRSDSLRRLEAADVVVFGGGNAYYLIDTLDRLNLTAPIIELMRNKVYVGISAGSIIAGPDLDISSHCVTWAPEDGNSMGRKGLALTTERIRPHLNSISFPHVTNENVERVAGRIGGSVWALDDFSALSLGPHQPEAVGSGKWLHFA